MSLTKSSHDFPRSGSDRLSFFILHVDTAVEMALHVRQNRVPRQTTRRNLRASRGYRAGYDGRKANPGLRWVRHYRGLSVGRNPRAEPLGPSPSLGVMPSVDVTCCQAESSRGGVNGLEVAVGRRTRRRCERTAWPPPTRSRLTWRAHYAAPIRATSVKRAYEPGPVTTRASGLG
jgi:hypothetical protein